MMLRFYPLLLKIFDSILQIFFSSFTFINHKFLEREAFHVKHTSLITAAP